MERTDTAATPAARTRSRNTCTITPDVGCIGFGPAMMISRDLALAQQLAVIKSGRIIL